MNKPTKIDKKNENSKYPKIQTMTNGRQLRTNIESLNLFLHHNFSEIWS